MTDSDTFKYRGRFGPVTSVRENRLDVVQAHRSSLRYAEVDERYADNTRCDIKPQLARVLGQGFWIKKRVHYRKHYAQPIAVDHEREPYLHKSFAVTYYYIMYRNVRRRKE